MKNLTSPLNGHSNEKRRKPPGPKVALKVIQVEPGKERYMQIHDK